MAHTITKKSRLLARVRRIKGQAAALETMLGNGAECLTALQQIAAIRGAVNGLMTEILEGQIREHVAAEGLSPLDRQREVDAIGKVLRSYLK